MKNILYAYSMHRFSNSLCPFPDLLFEKEKEEVNEYLSKFSFIRCLETKHLAPVVLANRLWRETSFKTAAAFGTKQYVTFCAGWDIFSFSPPNFAKKAEVFTVGDIENGIKLWSRLAAKKITPPENCRFLYTDAGFEKIPFVLKDSGNFSQAPAFVNLGTIPFYISKKEFSEFLSGLYRVLPKGSEVIFSYPDKDSHSPKAPELSLMTAEIWQFNKKVHYSYADMENILSRRGFLIYEHLTPREFDFFHFPLYSLPVSAPQNTNFCLGVKKY